MDKISKIDKFLSKWNKDKVKTKNKSESESDSDSSVSSKRKDKGRETYNTQLSIRNNVNDINLENKITNTNKAKSSLSFLPNPKESLDDKYTSIYDIKTKVESDDINNYGNKSHLTLNAKENSVFTYPIEENNQQNEDIKESIIKDSNIRNQESNNSSILKAINYQLNKDNSNKQFLSKKQTAKQKYGW